MKYVIVSTALLVGSLFVSFSPMTQAQDKSKYGPDPQQWDAMVGKAIQFLRSSQDENGGWSTAKSPGVTGIVVTGLLKSGKVGVDDPMVAKGLKYIESLVNPKAKHIAGADPRVQLQNYVTCINVMALVEANKADKYKAVIGDAVEFLKQLQWDEGEGKKKDDDFYGGAGYDSKSRPDLSNTQFFLEALKSAGLPPDDPAFKKAAVFVSRAQNLKSEHNAQPWAGKINDGSFIYTPAQGGVTKVKDDTQPGDPIPGYGSMTYAGIKSLIYAGVGKDDPRIKKAFEWIKNHYTVDSNPSMPEVRKEWGLYYYYHTMARSLDAMGVDVVVDSKGVKHDWRKDIAAALAKRQSPNGSWDNETDRWMEGDPSLVTGYALMALSYCRPQD
jgi:squalene-hopene/tetraprenyl-beta-curcumene cyclase